MSNRAQRRADLHDFKRARTLLTFLIAPDDVRLAGAPLLQQTANNWIDLLSQRVRHCVVCSSWIADRRSVGALLLATPATVRPTSASACGICRECWDADLPANAIEHACATVLHGVIPGGRFEPHQDTRR